MLPAFLVYLREGLEIGLLVSLLLATVIRAGAPERVRDIWAGVVTAALTALLGGILVQALIGRYVGTPLESAVEGVTYGVAAVVLTYMIIWLGRQQRTHSRVLAEQVARDVAAGGAGLFLLAYVTVLREGLEVVLLSLALGLAVHPESGLVGAVLGAVVAVALAVGLYRGSRRLNLRRFFQVSGLLLVFFAGGLLANALDEFRDLGWFGPYGHALWNTSRVLSEDGLAGNLLHGFFGYVPDPFGVQVGAYVIYMVVTLAIFLLPGWGHHRRA
jgi:high-affinity iron transporter